MKTIDRLFSAVKAERELVAEQKEVAHRLREVRKATRFFIIRLAAETGEPKPASKDWGCGCLEVDGLLWRDCKTERKAAAGRALRPTYEYEDEYARQAAADKAARDRITGADKEPCDRRRKAGAA